MIQIIEDEPVRVTRADYERYKRDWENLCAMHVNPPTLEDYIRRQLDYKRLDV